MNKRKKMRIRRRWQSTKKMKNCDPSRYLCMGTKGLLTSLFFYILQFEGECPIVFLTA